MSKELLLVMEAVANEKGVDRQVIVQAMEQALASAAKKRYHDEDVAIRVAINPTDLKAHPLRVGMSMSAQITTGR